MPWHIHCMIDSTHRRVPTDACQQMKACFHILHGWPQQQCSKTDFQLKSNHFLFCIGCFQAGFSGFHIVVPHQNMAKDGFQDKERGSSTYSLREIFSTYLTSWLYHLKFRPRIVPSDKGFHHLSTNTVDNVLRHIPSVHHGTATFPIWMGKLSCSTPELSSALLPVLRWRPPNSFSCNSMRNQLLMSMNRVWRNRRMKFYLCRIRPG